MKLIAAILALLTAAATAETFTMEWDYDLKLSDISRFEIEMGVWKPLRRGVWQPAGTAYETRFTTGDLARGVYQARVAAIGLDGVRSGYSNVLIFRVPYVAPDPPPTHVRLTITGGTSAIVLLDPIGRIAFYRLADDGTPQVLRSEDQVNWSPLGPSGAAGNYKLNSELVTITPTQ